MNWGRLVWVNTIPELVRIALVKFLSNPWLTEGSLVFPLCHHVLCTFRQRSLWAVHTQVSELRAVYLTFYLLHRDCLCTCELVGEQGILLWVATTHVDPTELTHCPGAVTNWLSGSIDLCLFDSTAGPDMGRKGNQFSQCLNDWEISFLFLSEASLEDIAQYLKQITFF